LIQVKDRWFLHAYIDVITFRWREEMKETIYSLETLTCPSCVAKIEGMLKRTAGVAESEVLFNTSRVKVTFDEAALGAEAIREKIEGLGYKVLGAK
jgi:copper chaperone CopZ